MDQQVVRSSLIGVLRKIQKDGGYGDADIIVGETVPLDDLDGFDSKLAPVAIKRLARDLGITIPMDRNIFREGGRSSGRKLTIDEIAARVATSATVGAAAPGATAAGREAAVAASNDGEGECST